LWHIAAFRCAASSGRYRAIADIERTAPIKLERLASARGVRRRMTDHALATGAMMGAQQCFDTSQKSLLRPMARYVPL